MRLQEETGAARFADDLFPGVVLVPVEVVPAVVEFVLLLQEAIAEGLNDDLSQRLVESVQQDVRGYLLPALQALQKSEKRRLHHQKFSRIWETTLEANWRAMRSRLIDSWVKKSPESISYWSEKLSILPS